jgi:adenylosuccinate synthase
LLLPQNTISAGACTGLGMLPKGGDVYGIFKAYCTRVGSGRSDRTIRRGGRKSETWVMIWCVTGRKRRCGWIDLLPSICYHA